MSIPATESHTRTIVLSSLAAAENDLLDIQYPVLVQKEQKLTRVAEPIVASDYSSPSAARAAPRDDISQHRAIKACRHQGHKQQIDMSPTSRLESAERVM